MSKVKIYEELVTIPTYEVGPADRNPMFLEKRVYQGSSGKIYPYPTTNEISRTKKDKQWKAVFLENEYIKVMILPELGGRIQRAYDKTNDYDFVYYNRVIKPALVGLTGPWISGGIEFNWPQHHRPTTFSPVDYKLTENADGSKTLLIGDVDQMYGTKCVTGFTLYPGKAYIEVTGQLYNRTPLPQTFLWWANPAVSVNDYTQSIFPPDVHSVYDHGKRDVSRFPIATGTYYKHDYSEGVDISRYKNIPVPTSYMAEKSEYDFVGGYDYSKKAGLLHVADHHISPGKKQWTWGCGDFGKAWDRNLTDEDGPYIELMTGMFCDNQPDFAWLKPYEEKVFKQYFMPYKAVGQVKNAGIHGALNMELRDGGTSLYICAYATQLYEEAEINATYKGEVIFREKTKLSPNDIYEKELPVNIEDEYRLKVSIMAEGKELISYQPKDQGIPKLAEPAKAAKEPSEILTNEELYLTGQHIEQYRHATWSADDYYLEGLKRDSGDTRINNAYGLLLLRRGRFALSEKYFRAAIDRLTLMHPSPFHSEAYYNLGLSLFYRGKYDEAFDTFYKAIWVKELQEEGFYYLSAIACRRGEYEEALDFIEKALVRNTHSIKARALKAMLLVRLGRMEEANNWIKENLKIDAFDYVSIYAGVLAGMCDEAYLHKLSRDFHETYLQMARDLAEAGLYDDALKVLDYSGSDHPMIHYYRAYYLSKLGCDNEAQAERDLAEKADPYCCFPNKFEDIAVLDIDAPRAMYYLGCLYYDKLQYDLAIELWEKAAAKDDTFPTLLRNLSIAYYNKRGDKDKAKKCLERAFELDTSDARVFMELDQLYQKLGISFEDRLANFHKHIELIQKRDDLYTEYVTLLNDMGRYEEAHDLISSHSFGTWEGAEGKITTQFKVSLLQQAKKLLDNVQKEAEPKEEPDAEMCIQIKRLLQEALSYPENLGEGRLEGTKDNNLYYYLGTTFELMGQPEKAREAYLKATLGAQEVAGVMYYYDQPADMILYQALALEKLGRRSEANARYYRLLDYGEQHLRDTFKMDYFAVSMPDMSVFDADMTLKNRAHCYYLMGLANLGLHNPATAAELFRQVLAIDNTHQNAILYLNLAVISKDTES
ncbi:DUF5107 domain-containing protein [Butyrivibrio sp. DSM 10294]|uniref:tetratricopeptide repeat protein n=1 Tax=Butyrivibrio sp. DSM 10294 TaxID=2972457 RepID=UPI00234EAB5D|nr:DUF5107 domain-containing protein [Butyrivibrio sp. DSM 10294]MDC7293737.1 DUF5107 domain-containing protein [Butyrivibrio sp. DSM 10294]